MKKRMQKIKIIKNKQEGIYLFTSTVLRDFQASSKRSSSAAAKNGVFTQMPMSYVGWTSSSSMTMKIISFLSTMQNRALVSVCLTSAKPFSSFTTCSFSLVIGAAILILTPLFLSFSNVGR